MILDLDQSHVHATPLDVGCHRLPVLTRITNALFDTTFVSMGRPLYFIVPDRNPLVMAATLAGRGDRGGTLVVRAVLNVTTMVRLRFTDALFLLYSV